MRAHADRADAGAAPAVRDTKRFMQVQMRHIRAKLTRLRHTHHGIHVGAIHVHLTTGCMDHVADARNGFFKHAMR